MAAIACSGAVAGAQQSSTTPGATGVAGAPGIVGTAGPVTGDTSQTTPEPAPRVRPPPTSVAPTVPPPATSTPPTVGLPLVTPGGTPLQQNTLGGLSTQPTNPSPTVGGVPTTTPR